MSKKNLGQRARNAYYAQAGKLMAGAALLAPVSVMAQDADFVAGVQSAADTGSPQLWTIGGIVVGVCAIGFLIGRGKRVSS